MLNICAFLPITLDVVTITASGKVGDSRLASRLTFWTTVILCWLFCATVVVCQTSDPSKPISQYVHNSWSSEDGLPSNAVSGILQTKDGYLWLATQEGIARFNGVAFKKFNKNNTEALGGNYINKIIEDHDGSIWAGVFGGGLVHFQNGRFQAFTAKDGISNNFITSLMQDREGNIWAGTRDGLNELKAGRFIRDFGAGPSLAHGSVTALAQDREGRIWVSVDGALRVIANGLVTKPDISELPKTTQVTALYTDNDDDLWIGTNMQVLLKLSRGAFTRYGGAAGVPKADLNVIYRDRAGAIWIGLGGAGLCRLWNERFDCNNSLATYSVTTIYEDREGSLWVGTEAQGLHRYKDGALRTYGAAAGLNGSVAWSVYEGRDGSIWVGMDTGLMRFKDGKTTRYITKNGPGNNYVYTILEDRDGNMWAGTHSGLNEFIKAKPGDVRTYTKKDGLGGNQISTIFQDSSGDIWVGALSGALSRFRNGHFTNYTSKSGLASETISNIYQDKEGKLWFGTDRKASQFRDERFTTIEVGDLSKRETSVGIAAFFEDSDHIMWIGSVGAGLFRVAHGKTMNYSMKNGMFDDTVYSILPDGQGNLWMNSNRGIFRANKRELNDFADGKADWIHSISYGTSDGMLTAECSGTTQPVSFRARNGHLLFACLKGVVVVDPARLPVNRLPPPVYVEQVLINRNDGMQENARVPAGEGNLEFHFSALSYLAPEKVQFKYKLEGFDREWNDSGKQRVAHYTNIPPGAYEFHVIAANNDGVWNETGASFSFYLQPHFYQTTWFYLLCFLSVLGLAVTWYRTRIHAMRAQQTELEVRVSERTTELRLAEEKYRGIFQEAIVGIFQTTPAGQCLSANSAMARMRGYDSPEELLASLASAVEIGQSVFVDPARREEFTCLMEKHDIVENFEYEAYRKDRSKIWFSENARAVRNAEGLILYYVGAVEDITQRKHGEEKLQLEIIERKRAEEAAKAAEKAANEANQAKSTFLATISHEIRTPMNGILGMTDLVLDTTLLPEQRDDLNMVKASANSLLAVINDILDFSKIEAGKMEFELIPFDLRESLEETVKPLSFRAHQKGLELVCDIREEVPDNVVGDPGRLRQVLINLVGNALKFTEQGEIVICVEKELQGELDVRLHFSVSDTGIGIPLEKQKSIFEAFMQADGSMTRKFGGTGLGLSICSRLVAMMGGSIWVENRLDRRGSVFHFTAHLGIHQQAIAKPVLVHLEELQGLPVLIVDDNATNRHLLVEMLGRWGMNPTAVESGAAGLHVLQEAETSGQAFPLILLDAQMPEMDGFMVAEQIRAGLGLPGTTVMMLTSAGNAGDAARCRELGIGAYLTKPVRQFELLEAIRAVLGARTAPGPASVPLVTRHSLKENRRPLQVLLAEDNPVNQVLAMRLLQKRGYHATLAKDGREALALLDGKVFDVVLMDIEMPVMDGFTATQAIRERERTTGTHLPIIAMTAHAIQGFRERCLAAGMDEYVTKPIDANELFEAIEGLHPDQPAADSSTSPLSLSIADLGSQ